MTCAGHNDQMVLRTSRLGMLMPSTPAGSFAVKELNSEGRMRRTKYVTRWNHGAPMICQTMVHWSLMNLKIDVARGSGAVGMDSGLHRMGAADGH